MQVTGVLDWEVYSNKTMLEYLYVILISIEVMCDGYVVSLVDQINNRAWESINIWTAINII